MSQQMPMNAYEATRVVEADAFERLKPYLRQEASNFVMIDKGPLAKFLQGEVGDIMLNKRGSNKLLSVELKSERTHTGNLFLETWSNKNLENMQHRADYGMNPGWLHKSRADLLFYYFLDTDQLYIAQMFALQRWAFGSRSSPQANLYASRLADPTARIEYFEDWYPEVFQKKYAQTNDTWGRLVPVKTLMRNMEPPMKVVTVRQLDMFDRNPLSFERAARR